MRSYKLEFIIDGVIGYNAPPQFIPPLTDQKVQINQSPAITL